MSERVLIIEDNPDNLELLRYLLQAFGYQTLCAEDGLRGVQLAREALPDLVLCDLQMPGIDGLEVARRLRAQPQTRHLPMVAVTAFARGEDRERALQAGFDHYMSKPIEPEQFLALVAQILRPTGQ
ncbi:response regulator [Pseudomarimonas arenosa]|uniref:Response regulator n=1 Tax=Pseudomarimonas arenosa TaxID=2774145 RepID=A0AAW3ZTS4_9GAMM|nr:response regulator [Pseudomarimonas arenosa]MBD8527767.1 response regulator [Pseudomarimonas arenosa]